MGFAGIVLVKRKSKKTFICKTQLVLIRHSIHSTDSVFRGANEIIVAMCKMF